MTPDIMAAVAAALAGKAVESTWSGGKKALAALTQTVRERFDRDDKARKALDDAQRVQDDAAIAELIQALHRVAAADPDFAARVQDLWPRVATEVNIVSGTVGGHLVQARDIHGGIRFGR